MSIRQLTGPHPWTVFFFPPPMLSITHLFGVLETQTAAAHLPVHRAAGHPWTAETGSESLSGQQLQGGLGSVVDPTAPCPVCGHHGSFLPLLLPCPVSTLPDLLLPSLGSSPLSEFLPWPRNNSDPAVSL